MTLRAVFFDMGGTIETYRYDQELRLRATPGIQHILEHAGIHLDLSTDQLYEVIAAGHKRYHDWSVQSQVELPTDRIWQEYILADFPHIHHLLPQVAEKLMFYIDTQWHERAMRPEMPAVLRTLRTMGLKIGLISNIPSLGQVPYCLEKYGIRHYFDPVVLSSEYRRRKPDPAIFFYAARLAKVPTSQCVYVGDRIARDVEGAFRAGFGYRVQIRHGFAHGETDLGATPDAVIDNMLELVDLLKAQLTGPVSGPGPRANGRIKALFFDAGDLLYHRPNKGQVLRAYLSELGLGQSRVDPAVETGLKDLAFASRITRTEYHDRLIRSFGIQDEAQVKRGIEILEKEDDEVVIFDGVPETMRALKARGFLLGIITDTALPVSTKLRWFERAGFGNVWDAVISSAEVGFRKPDPRIYRAGVEQVGVSFHEAAFVGHMKSELDGAHALGMPTITYNPDPDASADYTASHFSDLLALPLLRQAE